ncbi:hypothetical protein BC938DRAFT_483549 [Jimgerdemannia flammicorona]|uniref:Uncharacterized protein n=1 Tax=Jimgerdemannia flammicorona TaxID=994334 RepID=A0A433QBR4_9FUNG|nr:hypothetical protein BC938DRAFT_483549 [Jimgerdemannia flammicorona]
MLYILMHLACLRECPLIHLAYCRSRIYTCDDHLSFTPSAKAGKLGKESHKLKDHIIETADGVEAIKGICEMVFPASYTGAHDGTVCAAGSDGGGARCGGGGRR